MNSDNHTTVLVSRSVSGQFKTPTKFMVNVLLKLG